MHSRRLALGLSLLATSCVLGDAPVTSGSERLALLPDTLQLTSADSVKSFRLMTAPLGTDATWFVAEQPSWIALDPANGIVTDGPVTITARAVIAEGMDSGSYRDTVRITAEGLQAGILPVSLVVAYSARAEVTPTSIAFGTSADSATFQVKNAGHGEMRWYIQRPVTWLSVSPDSGTLKTGHDTVVTMRVDRTGSPGTYTADVFVSWKVPGVFFDPGVPVAVSMVVPTVPEFTAASAAIAFPDSLAMRFLEIGNTGTGTLTWAVEQKDSWITVSPASGTIGNGGETRLTITVDRAAAPRDVPGSIILATNSPKVRDTIPVTVTNALPASGDIRLLDHDIVDARFSRSLGLLLTTTQSFTPARNGLNVTDVATGVTTTIPLTGPVVRLAVRPDGRAAAVSAGPRVTFIDLETRTISRTVETPAQAPFQLVYAANDFAYVSTSFTCPTTIVAINAATGAFSETIVAGPPCYFTYLNAPESGNILYAFWEFKRRRYDISGGTPSVAWETTSNQGAFDRSWFTRDDTRIIGYIYGLVHQLSASQTNDLEVVGQIATGYDVAWLTDIPSRQRFYYLRATAIADSVRIADANSFVHAGALPVPRLPLVGGDVDTAPTWIFSTASDRLVVLTRGPSTFEGAKRAWTLLPVP